jgi:hypothetical protein
MDGCILLGYVAAISGACLFKFVKMPSWASLPYTVTGSDLYGTLIFISLIVSVHLLSIGFSCVTLVGQFCLGMISYAMSYQHYSKKYTVWFAIPSAVLPMLVTSLITALTSTAVTTVAAAASTTT